MISWFHEWLKSNYDEMRKRQGERSHGNGCYISIKNYLRFIPVYVREFRCFFFVFASEKRERKVKNMLEALYIEVLWLQFIHFFSWSKFNFSPAINSLVSKNFYFIPSYCFHFNNNNLEGCVMRMKYSKSLSYCCEQCKWFLLLAISWPFKI